MTRANSRSLASSWCASIRRHVPDRERITNELVGVEDLVEGPTGVQDVLALLVALRAEAALDLPSEALEGGGRDHALRRAADAKEDVGAGVGPARGDGAGHVAVLD